MPYGACAHADSKTALIKSNKAICRSRPAVRTGSFFMKTASGLMLPAAWGNSMTKAEKEQKRKETDARREFVNDAARTVGETLLTLLPGYGKSTEFRLRVKNENRYYTFIRYGSSLWIQIFRSGDIDVVLKEACHYDTKFRIVHYEEASKGPDDALADLRDDAYMLIHDFMHSDWHTMMDYMSHYEEGKDWRALYGAFRSDFPDGIC